MSRLVDLIRAELVDAFTDVAVIAREKATFELQRADYTDSLIEEFRAGNDAALSIIPPNMAGWENDYRLTMMREGELRLKCVRLLAEFSAAVK